MAIDRRPRGMCKGKRHGIFFIDVVDFLPTLEYLGARGIKVQLFLLDGLHFASLMRLMRGRFGLRSSAGEAFDYEPDRILH